MCVCHGCFQELRRWRLSLRPVISSCFMPLDTKIFCSCSYQMFRKLLLLASPSDLTSVVTFFDHVREISSLNLHRITNYLNWDFSWFSQSLKECGWIVFSKLCHELFLTYFSWFSESLQACGWIVFSKLWQELFLTYFSWFSESLHAYGWIVFSKLCHELFLTFNLSMHMAG